MLGKILSGVVALLTISTAYVGNHYQDKSIEQEKVISLNKIEKSHLVAEVDSVKKIPPVDTAAIWARGYQQAKEDKACSYVYSDRNITVTMGNGKCRYVFIQHFSSLKNEKRNVIGGGELRDASIQVR